MENLSLDVSGKNSFSVFQFFSFSVLLTEVFRNIPHFLVVQCMSYIFIYELDMWPPKRSLPNLEVKMYLKHCKNQCFFEKCRFWGGATIYIYIYVLYCMHTYSYVSVSGWVEMLWLCDFEVVPLRSTFGWLASTAESVQLQSLDSFFLW